MAGYTAISSARIANVPENASAAHDDGAGRLANLVERDGVADDFPIGARVVVWLDDGVRERHIVSSQMLLKGSAGSARSAHLFAQRRPSPLGDC